MTKISEGADQRTWFAARIVLEARQEGGTRPLFEDRILLVRAASEVEAAEKARQSGAEASEAYTNAAGEMVKWEFLEVLDVKEVLDDPLEDGTEIYSSYLAEPELASLRRRLDADSGDDGSQPARGESMLTMRAS